MTSPHASSTAFVDALVPWFEQLTPSSLSEMNHWYAAQARFKDPFKEVQGVNAIQAIFQHMFDTLQEPRFVVTQRVTQGEHCFLTWDFLFRFQGQASRDLQCIRGCSHLVLACSPAGDWRIQTHRDYWDAAEELYEKLPWVGALMRWLKRRVNA